MTASRSASRLRARNPLPWLVLASLAGACAPRNLASAPDAERAECHPEQDRAAILKMAGSYQVEFAFDETVSLSEGYALKAPYRASATEEVFVLENTPTKVSLQHVLRVGKEGQRSSLKHWRQDWTFEDPEVLEFRGHRSWARRALSPAEARCTWSQAVFEVDDGPRYEGVGRWTHARGLSAWDSRETWRPLPRREYTKRSDYDVLVGTNRHALTPGGWVHEQDTLKVVLGPEPRVLARERGTNLYARQAAEGGSPEVAAYWSQHQAYWAEVRQQWQALFQSRERFTLRDSLEGKPLHEHLFGLAGTATPGPGEGVSPETRERIRTTLERFLAPAGDSAAASTDAG